MSFSDAFSALFKSSVKEAEADVYDLTASKWSSTRWIALLAFGALVLVQVRLALSYDNLKLILCAYGIYTAGNTMTSIASTFAKAWNNNTAIAAPMVPPILKPANPVTKEA